MRIISKNGEAIVLFILLLFSSISFANSVNPAQKLSSFQQLPYFESNRGQFAAKTQFSAKQRDVIYEVVGNGFNVSGENKKNISIQFDQSRNIKLEGGDIRPLQINYIKGAKSASYVEKIQTYNEVTGSNIYPGINIVYYFKGSRFEYDFIVSPGVSPSVIALTFDHVDELKIDAEGNLDIRAGHQHLVNHAPFAYQLDEHNQKTPVQVSYALEDGKIRFNVAEYDTSRALIIDPIIEFSGLIGGEWEDQVNAMAADSDGNIYVVGSTAARARITYRNIITLENSALAVQKDPLHNHYFDDVHGISLDESFKNNNAIDLTNERLLNSFGSNVDDGYKYSCDYRYQGFFNNDRMVTDYDGFISKYSIKTVIVNGHPEESFELIYTTYFGGCRNDGIRAVVIDDNNNVYIAGVTLSADFPVSFPYQSSLAPSRLSNEPVQTDGFYAKLNKDGELVYSSYIGGNGLDGIRDIAVDGNENLYLIGYTHSTDLKTNCIPGKIPVLNCKYLGGVKSVEEIGNSQDVVIYSDAFIAKVASSGSAMSFLTYFGGKYDDWGQTIKINEIKDENGNITDVDIYIAGNTSSPDITSNGKGYSFASYRESSDKCSRSPIRDEIIATNSDLHLCEDVFLAKLSSDGSALEFSTYIGGARDDNVSDMEIDKAGNIYLVGTSRSKGGFFDLDNPKTFSSVEEQDAYNNLFLSSFPLYKNINQYKINPDVQSNHALFVVFNNDASRLITSGFIGGGGNDSGLRLKIRERNNGSNIVDAFIGGNASSSDFYTFNSFSSRPSNNDIFLVKLALDMNKKEILYDLPIEPYLSTIGSCYPSSTNGCGLYSILFSSLFGGESLDDLKDVMLINQNIYIAGTTFSKHFPIVGDKKLRDQVYAVDNVEYDPISRSVVDQSTVIPSDGYILKLNDIEKYIDLSLNVSMSNKKAISEGDVVVLYVHVANNSLVDAEKVSLVMTYPYLSSLEEIYNYVSTSLPLDKCAFHLTQLYCQIGRVTTKNPVDFFVSIKTSNNGKMPLTLALSAVNSDSNQDDNVVELVVDVKAVSKNGSLSNVFFLIVMVIFFIRLAYRNLKHLELRS